MKKFFLILTIIIIIFYFYKNKSSQVEDLTDGNLSSEEIKQQVNIVKEIKKENKTLDNLEKVTDPKKLEAYQNQWSDYQSRALANSLPFESSQAGNILIQNTQNLSEEEMSEEAKKDFKEMQQREETEQFP